MLRKLPPCLTFYHISKRTTLRHLLEQSLFSWLPKPRLTKWRKVQLRGGGLKEIAKFATAPRLRTAETAGQSSTKKYREKIRNFNSYKTREKERKNIAIRTFRVTVFEDDLNFAASEWMAQFDCVWKCSSGGATNQKQLRGEFKDISGRAPSYK